MENTTAGAVASSQGARAQQRCFLCKHNVSAGLPGSPRAPSFLSLGRGGLLPPCSNEADQGSSASSSHPLKRRLPGTRRLPQVLPGCTARGGWRGLRAAPRTPRVQQVHADLHAAPSLPTLLGRTPEKSALACFRWKGRDLSQRGLWLVKRCHPQAWCSDQIKPLLLSSSSKNEAQAGTWVHSSPLKVKIN